MTELPIPHAISDRYHAQRADSVTSDATKSAFERKWGPFLALRGKDPYGLPLPEPDDDFPLWPAPESALPIAAGQDSPPEGLPVYADDAPPPDWEPFGVVTPAVLPDGVPEVDILAFIAQGDDDDEEWLVQGLIPKGGLTILGGNPKSGKTLFALDLGLAVASGRSFFGRDTATAAFLFVTEEGSPAEMRKRLRRLVGSGGPPTLPGRVIYRRGVRFDDPRAWQYVRGAIERLAQPTLLVLDPLRDLLVGDENDSNTIATVNRSIHAILGDFPDITVILLHHLAKRGEGESGARLRGSTALWATADCILIFKADPIPDDLPEGGEVALRGVVSVEPRNAQRGRFFWRWDAETGWFLEAGAEARTLADKAAAFIGEHGPSTLAQIAEALGTSPDSVRVSLGREHSRFAVTPGEGPHDPSIWGLAE